MHKNHQPSFLNGDLQKELQDQIVDQVQIGVQEASKELGEQGIFDMAAQVVQSAQFAEIHDNFVKKLDDRKFKAQKNLDEVFEKFDELDIKMKDLRTQFKKDKKEARKARLDESNFVNQHTADSVENPED